MMHKWILLCGLLIICSTCFGQDKAAYIETYSPLAVSEMMRTGIPASIKLAQAILESNCGKSDLACRANNHFGIKCGNDWTGKSYNKEDDDYADGQLIKSCFREFRSVNEGYIAHSDFLADPAKVKRYGSLFQIPATDYKAWARGLSKSGYATDPQYADRLIEIIERYELYRFDMPVSEPVALNAPKESLGIPHVRYNNDVKYAMANADDTPATIARRYDVTVRQIIRYNEDIKNEHQLLSAGSMIYLQPKRSQFNGRQKFHMLKPGENMMTISQKYGVKRQSLEKRNGLQPGQIPAPNQKVFLKGKSEQALRSVDPYHTPLRTPEPAQQNHTADKTEYVSSANTIELEKSSVTRPAVVINNKPPASTLTHVVLKGETLFSIATLHGLKVDVLKKMNNLSVDTIFIGQKLVVK